MFINYTPFPGISFDNFDVKRMLNTTTVVRGKFKFHTTEKTGEWELRPDPDQGELFDEDMYYDDDLTQSVQFESDFAPFKPKTDVIFNGYAYAPDNQPQKQWQCGIKVEQGEDSLLAKVLNVTGKREWEKVPALGWRLNTPKPALKVSLRASNAYGGNYEEDAPDKPDEKKWKNRYSENPAGCGFLHKKDKTKIQKAPQIEYQDDPINSTHDNHKPAGFGWVFRHSTSRLKKAGSYDDKWLENDHPFYPKDFKDAHYQGAPEDQQIEGYLKGNEKISLVYLLPNNRMQSFTLPDYKLLFQYRMKDGEDLLGEMNLDTVVIDTESKDSNDWRVYITWRARTPAQTNSIKTEAMMIVPDSHKAEAEPEDNRDVAQGVSHG